MIFLPVGIDTSFSEHSVEVLKPLSDLSDDWNVLTAVYNGRKISEQILESIKKFVLNSGML
jgi:hypothetical protein